MSIQITELLRTSSVGADRATINSNFIILQDGVNDIESGLGLSLAQNSIDLTGGAGTGILKAKSAVIGNTVNGTLEVTTDANITKTTLDIQGGEGVITTDNIVANLTITVPTATVSTQLNVTGEATFSQAVDFDRLIAVKGGMRKSVTGAFSVSGLSSSYPVLLTDSIVKLDFDAAALTLTLVQPSPELPNGHIITLINGGANTGDLDTTNIEGFSTVTFADTAYKSSITLYWDTALAAFVVIGEVGMTLA